MRQRRAFTLRELLAVVTLMGIVFALLVPLIRMARDNARGMTCSNHLKQIGLSIHNYHSAYKQLPAAMFGTESNEHRLSGLIALTPFVEEQTFWERVANPSRYQDSYYPAMGPVPWQTRYEPWCTTIATYRCPSDPQQQTTLGRTNYAFCVGDKVLGLYSCANRNDVRGMFAPGRYTVFRSISDGLSNTIMMTEIGTDGGRRLIGQFSLGHPPQLADDPGSCLQVVDPQRPLRYDPSTTLNHLGRGGAFADGAGGYGLVHTILPPNSPSCAIGTVDPSDGLFSAGSSHAGGCYVLMGDGAVIFITDSIETGNRNAGSPRTARDADGSCVKSPYGLWGALGTRASEEIIEEQLTL